MQVSKDAGAQAFHRVDFGRRKAHAFKRQCADATGQLFAVEDDAARVPPGPILKRISPQGWPADIDGSFRQRRAAPAAALNADRLLFHEAVRGAGCED